MPPWWHNPVTLATRACHPGDTSLPPRWHDNSLGITKTSAPRKQGVYPEPKCFLTTAATRQWIRHGSSSYYVRGHAPTASLPTVALPQAIQRRAFSPILFTVHCSLFTSPLPYGTASYGRSAAGYTSSQCQEQTPLFKITKFGGETIRPSRFYAPEISL